MTQEYLTETHYIHECAKLNAAGDGLPGAANLYGIASFLLTSAYCAHRETSDNGEAPRLRVHEILGAWLTPERERNLFLRHIATLNATAEEIAERLFQTI
jgi:hypothetical protein